MFCTNCGTQNNDNAKFCKACGTKISTDISKDTSKTTNPATAKSAGAGSDHPSVIVTETNPVMSWLRATLLIVGVGFGIAVVLAIVMVLLLRIKPISDFFERNANPISVSIKSVYEIRDYGEDKPVIFVYEYPVFGGNKNTAKKMNDIYETQAQNNEISMADTKEFKREKNDYAAEDYIDALHTNDEQYYDITTCSVTYNKNSVVSIAQRKDWYMGGVLDISYDWHTFDFATGNELEITDIFDGSKDEIVERLQKAFVAEYGELGDWMEETGKPKFCLTEQGVAYVPENIFGYQRGASIVIPYDDAMVKKPFLTAVRPTVPIPRQPVPPPAIILTPRQLVEAYGDNEVGADYEYKGKLVQINGKIVSIGYDGGSLYITISNGGAFSLRNVDCYFTKDNDNMKKISDVKNGQIVTVQGTVVGMPILNIRLNKCVFVD